MDELRYPTGRFQRPTGPLSDTERRKHIDTIASTPQALRRAVEGLSDSQLDTPYRPGGWTVRQVIHHVPDSHLNAYVRFKLALTEERPTIKPYDEARWAELGDVSATPIATSLSLLDTLHERWVKLLRTVAPAEFERELVHPENGVMTLDQLLALYSWHGPHHVAHVTRLRERSGWK
jgi:uncharacterized damage-inducible protein DinB